MKKTILFGAMFLGSMAFAQKVGGEKDAHGCLPSAGYSYSQIKNDCIRVFEQKIKLKGVKPQNGASYMTCVIFSDDKKKAEIYIPGQKTSLILARQGNGNVWKNGSYVLVPYQKNGYQIKKDNVVIFQ